VPKLRELLYLQLLDVSKECGYLLLSPQDPKLRHLNTFRLDDEKAEEAALSRGLLDTDYAIVSPEDQWRLGTLWGLQERIGEDEWIEVMYNREVLPWNILRALKHKKDVS
jgi:hypothetical protein